MAYEYEKDNKVAVMINQPKANKELEEVYRKGKAFDEIREFINRKLKEEERTLLDDYEYGLYQAYDNIDDIIREYLEDE